MKRLTSVARLGVKPGDCEAICPKERRRSLDLPVPAGWARASRPPTSIGTLSISLQRKSRPWAFLSDHQ